MSAFAELGLHEDANEGDVKRAYARRLRTVRPDEDAEGFQALNAAYKAALAAVRWRAQAAADATNADATITEPVEAFSPPETPPPAAPETPVVPEPSPIDVPDALFDYATAREEGGIAFDFDAFSRDLFAVTADPEADLRAWLDVRMAAWPIAMKPTLAPHVLQALDDKDVAVSPKHFEILTAAFGLDDVLSGFDPLAIAQLREANEPRWAKREAVMRARRLLAPENRKLLDKAASGYPPFVAPMLARLVTGPDAARRTGLRWLPSLSGWVMNLLHYLSAGHVEALSPPIEPHVLRRWRSAESIIGWLRLSYVAFAVFSLLLLWLVVDSAMKSGENSLANESFEAIRNEEGWQPQKAIADYAVLIAEYPPPRSVPLDRTVATAMFNRGVLLTNTGRTSEAEAAYRDLNEKFGESAIPHVRLLVARGLNNLSYLLAERKDYQAALPVARTVIVRCQGNTDEDRGEDSMEIQLAIAMINEATILEGMGDREATLAVSRDFLFRFAGAHSDKMKSLIATAHDIEGDYAVQAIVPKGISSPLFAVPGRGATPLPPSVGAPTKH